MKRRILTLALVVIFALSMLPLFATAATVSSGLEKIELPELSKASNANNSDTQMGWATEGFEDEDTAMDVEASIAFRAVYLALEMPEMPGFIQFILQTPAGWWQQTEYDGEDLLEPFWEDGVLRLPFVGEWDMEDIRAKFLIGYYDDDVMDLGITSAWLEVYAEVEEGDLVQIRTPAVGAAANNNDENQMGWGTQGFEDEGLAPTDIDVAAQLLVRATHIVLEMPEMPGFMQVILQTPVNWWQQTDYGEDDLTEFWDEDASTLSLPIVGEWDPDDIRGKLQIAYYDDGVMDLGITDAWLLMGPEAELEPPTEKPEPPAEKSLPFDLGPGHRSWGDVDNQLAWFGDQRANDNNIPFDGGGGLTARLLSEAVYFVIFADNAPDDEEYEMVSLMIFGAASWSWEDNKMYAPTVQIWNEDLKAFVFPIGGHPYISILKGLDDEELDDRNWGISFEYDGGLDSLGITGAWVTVSLDDLPGGGDTPPPPPPTDDPGEDPGNNGEDEVEDEVEGMAWWIWLIIGGAAIVIIVVIVVIVSKKK
ncbi:MAG: hypothetical protein LBC71_05920 [Oscillospiraceae bacterium]|jgi:hypothetical protein|nr:hypothetical protein [Oscillospiraceae bacterium]